MGLPAGLQRDTNRRGPAGTELMGVSHALPVKLTLDEQTGQPWTEATWQEALREYQPQMLEELRVHVGGARFQTEPQFFVDGPHMDALQGPIYVMTMAAWFSPQALPVDCPAYRAWTMDGDRRG